MKQKHLLVYQPPQKTEEPSPIELMGIFGEALTEGDEIKRQKIKENPELRKGSWFAAPLPKNWFRL